MTEVAVTIYCHCAYYQIIPDTVKFAVLDAIKNAGMEVEAVPGDFHYISSAESSETTYQ